MAFAGAGNTLFLHYPLVFCFGHCVFSFAFGSTSAPLRNISPFGCALLTLQRVCFVQLPVICIYTVGSFCFGQALAWVAFFSSLLIFTRCFPVLYFLLCRVLACPGRVTFYPSTGHRSVDERSSMRYRRDPSPSLSLNSGCFLTFPWHFWWRLSMRVT
jgi:hypothetical protein